MKGNYMAKRLESADQILKRIRSAEYQESIAEKQQREQQEWEDFIKDGDNIFDIIRDPELAYPPSHRRVRNLDKLIERLKKYNTPGVK